MFDIILNPFRKLPLGYYRIFLVGWLLIPVVASMEHFFLGENPYTDGNYSDTCAIFFILLFAYYPVARIIVWVWQGFIKEGTLDVKHQNDIVKYENELLSLQKQIEDKDKNIALLKRDLEIEGNRTCYLKITTEQLIQVLAIRNRRMKDLESHFYLKRMLDAQKRDSYIHLSPEDWFNFFHAVGFENEWKALIDFKRVSEGIANDKK